MARLGVVHGVSYEKFHSAQPSNPRMEVKPELVQIKATSEDEVNRRIEAFTTNKRREINERNIREFISPFTSDTEASCARVEAVYVHREGEKSHISLKKVDNVYGPQTCIPADEDADDRNLVRLPIDVQRAEAVEERLTNMELHLNMPNAGEDIFKRVKALEERISYLEGLSPEYFSNGIPLTKQQQQLNTHTESSERREERIASGMKKGENLSDIDSRIRQLKQILKRKMDAHGQGQPPA